MINAVRQLGYVGDFTMFGFADTDFWMVGGSIIEHCINYANGSGKALDYRLTDLGIFHTGDGALHAAWGTSSNDMFFVGDYGTIFHFDGSHWEDMPKVTSKNLQSVWGTSHNDVWACGYKQSTGETAIVHYDGSSWTNIDPSVVGANIQAHGDGLSGTWACDSSGHTKIYMCGAFLYRKTDNGSWINDSATIGNQLGVNSYAALFNIRGNSSNDIMVQGSSGFIAHWNGKSWQAYSNLFGWSNAFYDTPGMSFKTNTACMVGWKNGSGYVAIGQRH